MKKVMRKLAVVLTFIALLCVAIALTDSELLLSVLLVILIFAGIPVLLVTTADIIRVIRGPAARVGFFSMGIHVTAVLAFVVGYLLYKMAIWSDHPYKDRHAYLPLLFVALVYGYPLIIWLKSRATRIFFDAVRTEEELDAFSARPEDQDMEHDK